MLPHALPTAAILAITGKLWITNPTLREHIKNLYFLKSGQRINSSLIFALREEYRASRCTNLRLLVAGKSLSMTKESKAGDVRRRVCIVLVHQPGYCWVKVFFSSLSLGIYLDAVLFSLAMLSIALW